MLGVSPHRSRAVRSRCRGFGCYAGTMCRTIQQCDAGAKAETLGRRIPLGIATTIPVNSPHRPAVRVEQRSERFHRFGEIPAPQFPKGFIALSLDQLDLYLVLRAERRLGRL